MLITTSFANWTMTDRRHRHEVTFPVTAESDVRAVKSLVERTAAGHPKVLGAPEAPVCELRGFGDKSLTFAVEFWVDGIEGGPHKVPSEVRLMIWEALKEKRLLAKP
jgi:small-conductance mechanosensitive channel